jgi:hypothetical protein
LVPNSGRYFGNDGLSMVQEIQADNNGDFVVSGLISGSDFTAPQYSNLSNSLLPNLQSRGFFVSKINGLTGDDVWVQQGITTGIGQWTKDITVDANSTIYLTGYLNGKIDFQQGDKWDTGIIPPPPPAPNTPECDNTYLIKVYDGQNQGIIERMSNSLGSDANEAMGKHESSKVMIVGQFSDLINHNPLLLQQNFSIYDMMGKELFQGSGDKFNLTSSFENGMYILRTINSNVSLRFMLSR